MRYLIGMAVIFMVMVVVPMIHTASAAKRQLTDEELADISRQAKNDAATIATVAAILVAILFGGVILVVFYMVYKNAT
jgi:hypothetical protein